METDSLMAWSWHISCRLQVIAGEMATRPAPQQFGSGAGAVPDFTQETDLALGRFGGTIIFATDGKKPLDAAQVDRPVDMSRLRLPACCLIRRQPIFRNTYVRWLDEARG